MSADPMDFADRKGQIARFGRLDVEGFTLSDGDDAVRCYERDEDLLHLDHLGGGTRRAVVLVDLGIDEYDCDRVKLDLVRSRYEEGDRDVIRQTISTLEVILAQLEAMSSTPKARRSEREAFEFGREAERAGLEGVRP